MKKNKLTIPFILLIVVLILGAALYANREHFMPGRSTESIYNFDLGRHLQLASQQGQLLVLSREGISAFHTNGQKSWSDTKALSQPVMSVAGEYTLVYDQGATTLTLYRRGKKVAELQADREILNAKVNAAGYMAVVSKQMGYKSKIDVYDNEGKPIYQWQIGESYIIDVDISPDCNRLAACALVTRGATLVGQITSVDINKEAILSQVERENSVPLSVTYCNNSTLIAVAEQELLGFDRRGRLRWGSAYADKMLTTFRVDKSGHIVLAFAGSRNNTIVQMYNAKGKQTGEYVSESEVKSLDLLGGTLGLHQQKDVLLLGMSGKQKARKTAEKEIRSLVLMKQNVIAVMGGSSIELIK